MESGSRDIPLGSVLNVRDLGGLRTSSGQAVQKGRLIRGAKPDNISEQDLDTLIDAGIKTIVDLRASYQFDIAGQGAIGRRELNHVNVSLSRHVPTDRAEADYLLDLLRAGTPMDHRTSYLRSFANTQGFARVLEVIADPTSGGVYVHCTGGKDRTGVIVAAVLLVVGVPREDVVADYAETGRVSQQLIEASLSSSSGSQPERDSFDDEVVRSYAAAPPEAMDDVLRTIDEQYGSMTEYVLQLPNGAHIVENLERKMLG